MGRRKPPESEWHAARCDPRDLPNEKEVISVLDRLPTGIRVYATATDPRRRSWREFVLPHVDKYDQDHCDTV